MMRPLWPLRSALVLALVLASAVVACGDDAASTDDHQTLADAGDTQPDSQTPDAAPTADTDPPQADTTTADADSGGEADADATAQPDTPSPAAVLADGVTITEISALQTIETKLVVDSAQVASEIPLVAGRETLFRVLVSVDAGWTPAEVTAEVLLVDGATDDSELLADTLTVAADSTLDERGSVFEVRVPAASLTADTSVSFRLIGDGGVGVDEATPSPARWPRDGSTMPLAAAEETGTLHVVLVPFRYESDGSNRLPDTSDAQLALFEDALGALYPAQDILLEVRDEVAWTGWMRFGSINRELRTLKQDDGAEHAYYYGLIRPEETFGEYCSGTCTTGQSFTVSSAEATSYRVGSGLGYSGERWAWTLVHELGHMHGRGHAPCGVSFWSQDSSYPHADGVVGVWGWDAREDALFGPEEATDFMGYCDDLWASDYTYMGIYERMQAANDLQQSMSLMPPTTWRYVNWSDARRPTWGRTTRERNPYSGEWAEATFVGADGGALWRTRIPFIRYAHGGERSVLVPSAPEAAERVEIGLAGHSFTLELP
jgi:hypothetical protein